MLRDARFDVASFDVERCHQGLRKYAHIRQQLECNQCTQTSLQVHPHIGVVIWTYEACTTFSNPGVADSTVVILHRSDDNHHTLPIFEPLCKFMRCGCKRLQSFSIFQFFMLWMYIPGLQKKKKKIVFFFLEQLILLFLSYFILGSSFLYKQDQRYDSGTKFRYENIFVLHREVSCKLELTY